MNYTINEIILNTIDNHEYCQPSIVEVQDNLWDDGYEINGQILVNTIEELGYRINRDNTISL